ncbi:hypothetical protein RRF57_009817 [Xylaria bambusicola]|uniref:Transposase Tc1-like domain-containing protein n=1 Tax=Xylaria bambusicola TaxID=326684 RepID=A0AAN7ZC76_9PEZI
MSSEFDLATRSQALALHSEGYSRAVICEKTGYSPGGLANLITKAKKRGYQPGQGAIIAQYVEDKPRKGRPVKLTPEKMDEITKAFESDPSLRKLPAEEIAKHINDRSPDDPPLSRTLVQRALKHQGLKNIKYTTKPGLHQ